MNISAKKYFLDLGVFSSIFFIDRLTKSVALFFLNNASWSIITHVFSLKLVLNKDVLFAHESGAVFACLLFLFLLMFLKARTLMGRLFFCMIISGALSNMLDVSRYGAVIDWIEIPSLTIFNFADLAIVIGCIGLLFSLLRKKT